MPEVDINNLIPRNNAYLLGFEAEEKFLLDAWKNNTLHNSWLISGIEGIGKATLVYKFARFILNADYSKKDSYNSLDVSENTAAFKLVANNSHPDLKIIERDYTETDRKKVMKSIKDGEQMSNEELKSLKKSAFIRIDDVRTVNEFLSKRSGNDGWRVVVVDSIDDMNTASANAILKVLEEPPHKTLMLLISHNPNRLLPTIKSRCAKLNLKPLDEKIVASLLRRYRPELSEKAVKELAGLSSGSIGKAIMYADNDALNVYEKLSKIIYAKDKFSINDVLDFCNAGASDDESYELTKELILKFIAENIRQTQNMEEFAKSWEEAVKIFSETSGLNLDKKQALMNIIVNLCKRI